MYALVVDDERQIRQLVSTALSEDGWTVGEADSVSSALDKLSAQDWDLVVCDVMLGDENGFSVLRRVKDGLPSTKVIMMTGRGSALGALDATALGAFDYVLKPFDIDDLITLARYVREQLCTELQTEDDVELTPSPKAQTLVGRSESFIKVMKQVGRVAGTNLPVMLTGESGTGKEVVAAALHRRSDRADRPFVAVNCGAIPAELIESELFGHQRGSFTGADRDRVGLWEEADGGTVFLDEITETTPAFQVKLLRALQQGEIRRVGSNRTNRVDVRVIAASNRDVEKEIKAGRFREDLYYRLNAVSIVLPPLRERPEDILPLAQSFAWRASGLEPEVAFSYEAIVAMEAYSWPGNIRELENAVVRAAAMCDQTIREQDLPERVRAHQRNVLLPGDEEMLSEHEEWPPLAEIEGRYVARVFAHTKGNKQAAARLLKIDRKTLERMIKRHSIPTPATRLGMRMSA
jgi:two-component system, NtrC family, response regulator AtoC